MMRYVFVIFFVLLAAPASAGNFENGNSLYKNCQGDTFEQTRCMAYISAIADVLGGKSYNSVAGYVACIPLRVNLDQLRSILVKWLNNNPQYRHYAAPGLVAAAFEEAFPCK